VRGWNITVTWMDGRQETYRAESYRVIESQVMLTGEDGSYGTRDTIRSIPLHNVRIWKAEQR
jgi:hypothetical protein